MKKLITAIIIISLYSCTKEAINEDNQGDLNKAKVIPEATTANSGSTNIDFYFYDCAAQDNIHVTGELKDYLKFSLTKSIEIVNVDAIGVGYTSGIIYHCKQHEVTIINKGVTTSIQKLKFISADGAEFTSNYLLKYYWDANGNIVVITYNYVQTPCK